MLFEPTDEQRLIVDTVREFVRHELCPHESEVERLDEVPASLAAQIRQKALASGLYAANMPAELGGGGLDAVSMTLVERELGHTGYALQSLVARPSNILIACEGNQRDAYLLPTIRGERVDCLAMSTVDAARMLAGRFAVSQRQARRYVDHATSGARVPDAEATTVFTVRLPASLAARVRGRARESGGTISALVAQALTEFLARGQGKHPHQ
jgi:acyl-CoA dehydrogenase